MTRKLFVGGNFKMNGDLATLTKLVHQFNEADVDVESAEVVIAPPALYLLPLKELARKGISVAAQNAHQLPAGAYTGEISLQQLKDIGLNWVILGHSERRTIFHESDELVAEKTAAAIKTGVSVIFCIGETLEEREGNKTEEVVTRQTDALAKVISEEDWKHIVVAYEPGASHPQAQDTHKVIRDFIAKRVSQKVADDTRIIYGGSVSGKNSKELCFQPDIDGALVGGASLTPQFIDVIRSAEEAFGHKAARL
ncbi:triose-phosphate isomerase-like protein [Rhodotorula toruloides]